MTRTFHKLTTATTLRYPHNYIFVDTETTTLQAKETTHNPQLRVGFAEYVRLDNDLREVGHSEKLFFTVDEFWSFFEKIATGPIELTMYAHNWSFDLPVLDGLTRLPTLGYELKAIVDESPPIIIRYVKDQTKINIVDSLNYFRTSLAELGKSLGMSKGDIDVTTASVDELIPYCKNDVAILRVAILNLVKYLRDNDLTSLKHTVSSIALSAYIRKFKPRDIFIDGNEQRTQLARRSYFGGRTEAFKLGKFTDKFYLIDINSQYPFVMKNNRFPYKTTNRYKRIYPKDIEQTCYTSLLTLHCRVNTEIAVYPIKINGRTCFPIGEFDCFLSTPEIQYAIENNHLIKCYEAVYYDSDYLFTDYVDYFYTQRNRFRDKGQDAWSGMAKLLLNSLSGKFGQSLKQWEKTNRQPDGYPHRWFEFDAVTSKRVFLMELNDVVFEALKGDESNDSYPAIAAHVTAHGRMMLRRMIDYLSQEHVYYCDTDSLLIDEHAYTRLKDKLNPRVLGCWALEGEYDNIDIRGVKDYTFGPKTKIKGVKKNAVLLRKGLYEQLQFSSLKANIMSGNLSAPTIRLTRKQLTRKYMKGHVGVDGIVSPFRLPLPA